MAEDIQHTRPDAPLHLPRITIKFCTQCKWLLRAAYFAQELLSTFSTSLGEVALVPSTGGVFVIDICYAPSNHSDTTTPSQPDNGDDQNPSDRGVTEKRQVLWDRKAEGGFPETKELKRRVRDCIDPSRDLGHVDGPKSKAKSDTDMNTAPSTGTPAIPAARGDGTGREERREGKEDCVECT